jgi:hypothetical protein
MRTAVLGTEPDQGDYLSLDLRHLTQIYNLLITRFQQSLDEKTTILERRASA